MKYSIAITTTDAQFRSHALLDELEGRLTFLSSLGYNGVDLAVRDRRFVDPAALNILLGRCHMTMPSLGTDPLWVEEKLSLADAEGSIRKAALTRVLGYLPLAYKLKSVLVIGLVRGEGKGVDVKDATAWLVESLKALCTAAEEFDIAIGLEPINRGETTIVNTIRQGLDVIGQVSKRNLGLVLNTYHMNTEETMMEDSIRAAKGKIMHVKVADSNRRSPGSGYIKFSSILGTLVATGYNGYLSGAFLPVPTAETAAQRSITYLRSLVH